ncbi:hypothetical protein [Streptomyces sp. MP131-18]|uniref:hypothetical protein n=1 Tax=Streptomyces sp. MP131-18 TaxID=1857892 RepID=UPI00097C089B|nr:hypothetical protein [Streptomyces sp. MP131-18]ONK09231.1 hypothetical protein STBA_71680 [Streptomyces sp. MP131-18]
MTTTTENTVNGPDEPGDGVDWALLDQQVFGDAVAVDEQPAPAPAAPAVHPAPAPAAPVVVAEDVAGEDEVDPDADAHLWPVVLDDKDRPTTELARPNPQAMRAALKRASAVSAADVEVLAEAVSEPETREIINQAVAQRGHVRELGGKVARLRADLAAAGARKQAEHEARLADARRRRENRATAALERRDRALDPTSRIVRLAAAERWVPWIAVLPAALAAVLGAFNVKVCLDILSPGTAAINWMVEPLLTLPIIAILAAQILGAIGEGEANPYRGLEWTLVGVALVLNVGLHAVAAETFDAAAVASSLVWAIVPAGLAISAHLVPKLIRTVRQALASASVEPAADRPAAPASALRTGTQTGPVHLDSAWTEPGPSQVSEGEGLDSRTEAEIAAEFAEAVREGRIDPQTGRAMDPESAESIRRTLRVGRARARALRDQARATE